MTARTSFYGSLDAEERADMLTRLTSCYGWTKASEIMLGQDEDANRDHLLWRHLTRDRHDRRD